jgi:hypothetical protein
MEGPDQESSRTNNEGEGRSPQQELTETGLGESARFVRKNFPALSLISAIVLVPCFWHRQIFAADMGSHLYNAWLVQLIERDQVHGLSIARRWNNVLFDYLLSGLAKLFSFNAVEKIAVSLVVLTFFWGVFALVCAATRRAPWFILPCIALGTYGYTFHMGFFNYFISLGLAFWGIAIFWRGKGWQRIIALALAPLILLAHPLGLVLLIGCCAYVAIAEKMRSQYQVLLVFAAAVLLFITHQYLWRHYVVEAAPRPLDVFTGADQLLLFSGRYRVPEIALVVFVILSIAVDLYRRSHDRGHFRYYAIPFCLYLIVEIAVPLLPRGVRFPQYPGTAMALLTERLTLVSAVFGCCLLGAMRPSRWHLAGSMAIAAVFFTFVYQDTGTINRMESQIEKLVSTLPPGQRVMGTILPPGDSRIPIQHILDRACIGRCFSYGNYEPGSGMFRVRAAPGNPYVLSSYTLAVSMEDGDYTVQPQDLPLYQIYQCSLTGTDLCITSLEAGQDNDEMGVHPPE